MPILCHREVLALHSALFRSMLADLPARQSDGQVKVLYLDYQKRGALLRTVKLAYTNVISVLGPESALSIIRTAS